VTVPVPAVFAWNVTVIVCDCPAPKELELVDGEQLVSGGEHDADRANVPVMSPMFVTVNDAVPDPSANDNVVAAALTTGSGQWVVDGSQIRRVRTPAVSGWDSAFRVAAVAANPSTRPSTATSAVRCERSTRMIAFPRGRWRAAMASVNDIRATSFVWK
jgi:hypothetical protein